MLFICYAQLNIYFYNFIQLTVPEGIYNIGKTPTNIRPHKSSEKTRKLKKPSEKVISVISAFIIDIQH